MRGLFLSLLLVLPLLTHAAENATAEKTLEQAREYIRMRQGPAAVEILKPLAESGDREARMMLGITLFNLMGDLEGGRYWIRPMAEDGDPRAQLHMAVSYLGRGSKEGDKQGIQWLKKAANNDSAEAAAQLAMGYQMGWWGLPKNAEAAGRWNKRAEELRASQIGSK